MSVWEQLGESAVVGHGITLQPAQVKELVADMRTLSRRYEFLQNMNVAYMNEYGPELFYELVGDDITEGEVEDAEGGNDASGREETPATEEEADTEGTIEESETFIEGQVQEADRDDAQDETEGTVEVSEVQVDGDRRGGDGYGDSDDPHSPYVL